MEEFGKPHGGICTDPIEQRLPLVQPPHDFYSIEHCLRFDWA